MTASSSGQRDQLYPVSGNAFGWPLIVLSVLQLMVVLDGTVVNLALARIQTDLNLSEVGRSWIVIAYALAYGGLLLLGGRLGDTFGRKRMFLLGVGLFTAASALCGAATSEAILLAARVLQGMGAAIASPTAMALIVVTFAPGKTRAQAFSVFAAMTGIGSVVGLVLGGALTQASWRWIFWINIPFGVLILVAGTYALAVTPAGQRLSLDIRGAILATAGSTLLVYGMTASAISPVGATIAIVVGILILIAFFVSQRSAANPIVPLSLFRLRDRSVVFICLLLAGALMMAMTVQVALFVQNVLEYSPLQAGIAFLPFAGAMVVGFGIAGQLSERVAPRYLVGTGGLIVTAGFIGGAQLGSHTSYWPGLLLPIITIGVGVGLIFIPLTLSVVAGVSPTEVGPLTALSLVAQTVGGPIGLAAVTAAGTWIGKRELGDGFLKIDHQVLTDATRQVVSDSYTHSLYVCAAFALVLALLCLRYVTFTPRDIAEGKKAEEASQGV